MKRFLMFSVSVLCLALTALIGFYIGSHEVEAQNPPAEFQYEIGGYNGQSHYLMLPNGDVYLRTGTTTFGNQSPASYVGNFFEGGAVSTEQNSWSGVKGQFEKGE